MLFAFHRCVIVFLLFDIFWVFISDYQQGDCLPMRGGGHVVVETVTPTARAGQGINQHLGYRVCGWWWGLDSVVVSMWVCK